MLIQRRASVRCDSRVASVWVAVARLRRVAKLVITSI
jgi:hypothetical protein